jgi:ABC-2 type transport system ATP-binding protein
MGFHDFLTPTQINTVMKNIYKNWDEATFFDYLKKFSLPSRKACGKFSRGMRMKLQIATAMSHGARLLIMDEPTSGLDPIVRNEIIQIFREFVVDEEHSILLSSHITTDLEKIADEVVFIDGGRIVLAGNKDEILEKHGLLRCRKDEADAISKSLIVDVDVSGMCAEILVNDRKAASKLYPGMVIDDAGLEQIMIHYVNGSRSAGSGMRR